MRCSGGAEDPHEDVVLKIPAGETVYCEECGRAFRRKGVWNQISGAVWPDAE